MSQDLSLLKDYEYPEIAKRFFQDTAGHQLEILHDDGLYRHLRMKHPAQGCYWYDVITTPGFLTFNGDGTSYVFSSVRDMFEMFRNGIHQDGSIHINPGYWSEKLKCSGGDGRKQFDADLFEKQVWVQVEEAIEQERVHPSVVEEFKQAVRDDLFECFDWSYESEAVRALEEFRFRYAKPGGPKDHWGDLEKTETFVFDEWYEWFGAAKDYPWWLLWTLYAIPYAIRTYDREKGSTAGVVVQDAKELPDTMTDITRMMRVL